MCRPVAGHGTVREEKEGYFSAKKRLSWSGRVKFEKRDGVLAD